VLGDNRPGLANRIARALAESNVNIAFLVAQVVGTRYSAVFGFESEADLDKAADRIRAAVVARPIVRPAASRRPGNRASRAKAGR
jgi:predicted amino acid-binding ACT domain protein